MGLVERTQPDVLIVDVDYIAEPDRREERLERVFRGVCMGITNPASPRRASR